MVIKKPIEKTYIAATFFIVGLIIMDATNILVKDTDKYHWLLLAPIVFPFAGIIFSLLGMRRPVSLGAIFIVAAFLANLALAGLIFFTYSFSYWQF